MKHIEGKEGALKCFPEKSLINNVPKFLFFDFTTIMTLIPVERKQVCLLLPGSKKMRSGFAKHGITEIHNPQDSPQLLKPLILSVVHLVLKQQCTIC